MSPSKNFDIGPRTAQKKKQKSAQRVKVEKVKEPPTVRRRSLRERRRAARNFAGGVVIVLFFGVCALAVYGLWRPEVRITDFEIKNMPDKDRAHERVESILSGTYFGLLPRNSIFLYPEQELRSGLLDAFPSLSAVSISRTSFESLSFSGMRRVTSFYWCGTSGEAFSLALSSCYEADAHGVIFSPAPFSETEAGSSTPKTNERLRIYAPVEAVETAEYPLRAQVVGFDHLPDLLRFISAIQQLGIPVLSTEIVGDEATLFVTPETRIRYVLGREEEAARAAEAAFPSLNLLDGSIEYVDVRFGDTLYVKRYE